ncbi:hypothetical protein [Rudanella lutea]|uniref:hypothetical protein n=1 Tax=Rudanella lutea TaxID=451374 RepID=UPI0003819743|nr:hypothetical protein [Rudanella lutea]
MELTIDFASEQDKKQLWRVLKTRKPRRYRIQIVEERARRSNPQNAYYWGVVLATLATHTGFTDDELHEYFKVKFLACEKTLTHTGEVVRLPGSTATLDTAGFSTYLDQIIDFAIAELDCFIPLPDQTIVQSL